jgi:hypothetical protein
MPKTKTALTTLSFYDAYFLSVPADTPREQVITASKALFKRMSAKARPEVAVLGLLAEQSVKTGSGSTSGCRRTRHG